MIAPSHQLNVNPFNEGVQLINSTRGRRLLSQFTQYRSSVELVELFGSLDEGQGRYGEHVRKIVRSSRHCIQLYSRSGSRICYTRENGLIRPFHIPIWPRSLRINPVCTNP